jgi:hypothetical protein
MGPWHHECPRRPGGLTGKRANGAPSPTGDGAPFGVWR